MPHQRITLFAAAIVLALMPAAVTFAQHAEADQDGPRRGLHEGRRGIGRTERARRGEVPFAGLDLTDPQKAKVRQVMEAHREAVKDFRQTHADQFNAIRQKLQAAREAKDHEALEAAMEPMQALHDQRPKFAEVLKELEGVLTDDQIEKLKAHLGQRRRHGGQGPDHGGLVQALDLTPEQAEQVRGMMRDHGQSVRKYIQSHRDEIRATIQRLRQAKQAGDDEAAAKAKAELKAIGDARPKFDGLLEDLDAVLSDEQLAQFKAMAETRHERRRDRWEQRRDDRPRRGHRPRAGQGDGDDDEASAAGQRRRLRAF